MAPDITMTFRILLLLGALSAFGPMAIDFYLPSFPALAKAFVTDVEHVQLTLASYFIGLAFGQLIYGPLADRFGRRPPLLLGVVERLTGSRFNTVSAGSSMPVTVPWTIEIP